MKSVLIIYAIAILTFGAGGAYIQQAIESDVSASKAERYAAQFKYELQPADNFVFTLNPVAQGDVVSHLQPAADINLYQKQ